MNFIYLSILFYCSTRLRPRPHISVFRLKAQLFRCGYGFCPHVSNENGHRKRNFLKTLSRVEFFEFFENVRVDRGKRNFLKTMMYISIGSSLPAGKKMARYGDFICYVSALHKPARKYARVPKACAKLLYYFFWR